MSLIVKIVEWCVDNFKFVIANWGTFLIFAVLTVALTHQFTEKRVKKRYDSLPERIALKEQVERLMSEKQELQDKLRDLQTSERLLRGVHGTRKSDEVGKLIDAALHKN